MCYRQLAAGWPGADLPRFGGWRVGIESTRPPQTPMHSGIEDCQERGKRVVSDYEVRLPTLFGRNP